MLRGRYRFRVGLESGPCGPCLPNCLSWCLEIDGPGLHMEDCHNDGARRALLVRRRCVAPSLCGAQESVLPDKTASRNRRTLCPLEQPNNLTRPFYQPSTKNNRATSSATWLQTGLSKAPRNAGNGGETAPLSSQVPCVAYLKKTLAAGIVVVHLQGEERASGERPGS